MNDVLATQTKNKVLRKINLSLEIKRDGTIKPIFYFKEKGGGARKDNIKIECPEVFIANFGVGNYNTPPKEVINIPINIKEDVYSFDSVDVESITINLIYPFSALS